VTLTGGALAKNVIWQVAGATAIGTTAHFEGILLDATSIAVNTGASVTGRLLAQTAVTLQMNTVTQPADAGTPSVATQGPVAGAVDVATSTTGSDGLATGAQVSVGFSEAMSPESIVSDPTTEAATFTLVDDSGASIPGTVTMNTANTLATLTPTAAALNPNTLYTATVSAQARNNAGMAIAHAVVWSFRTKPVASATRASVNLGAAGTFALLSKSGVTDVYASAITGDVGSSPITGAAILISCAEVTGTIYSVDAAGPAPCVVTNASLLTTAVGDMQAAYTDAAGRSLPDFTELGAGEIGGLTLTPGLYKWGTGVLISTDVTLNGGPNDVWIFQVAGTLTQASATRVTLTGGAVAKNVIWQVAGATTIGTTAHFEGILLDQTSIAVNTGASVTGRLLAQTAVTLQMNAVTQPTP
jgi:hypothetical protein